MTNEQAHAQAAAYPHLDAKYFAFYSGRNAAEFGDKCGFTDAVLKAEWAAGYRQVRGEIALDQDTEWDED